tara:strand:+ start:5251 stop:5595 length:345 start_codon:yes stop_codon:yes gene_type:complete
MDLKTIYRGARDNSIMGMLFLGMASGCGGSGNSEHANLVKLVVEKTAGYDLIVSPEERGKMIRAFGFVTSSRDIEDPVLIRHRRDGSYDFSYYNEGRHIGTVTEEQVLAYLSRP